MRTSAGPVAAALACLIVLPAALALGQGPAKLNIVVLESGTAIDNVRQRIAREPIVRVEDENHRPVAGAMVTFELPRGGASAVMANGSTSFTAATDQAGRVALRGMRLISQEARFDIQVKASYKGLTAVKSLPYGNVAPPVGTVSSEPGLRMNGRPVQTTGAPNWPVAAGDVIATGTKPAMLVLNSGVRVKISPSTQVAVLNLPDCTVSFIGGSICYKKPLMTGFSVCRDRKPLSLTAGSGTVSLDPSGQPLVSAGACGVNKTLIIAGAGAGTAATLAIAKPGKKSKKNKDDNEQ